MKFLNYLERNTVTRNKIKQIDVSHWDDLIIKTYGKMYSFQHQDENNGTDQYISVPNENPKDYENDTVPETLNYDKTGVSFKAWVERDPTQKLSDENYQEVWCLELWWHRNFYPHVDKIANDLYIKGLLKAGEYRIIMDW